MLVVDRKYLKWSMNEHMLQNNALTSCLATLLIKVLSIGR